MSMSLALNVRNMRLGSMFRDIYDDKNLFFRPVSPNGFQQLLGSGGMFSIMNHERSQVTILA